MASFNIRHFGRLRSRLGLQLSLLLSLRQNGTGIAGMLAGEEGIHKELFLMRPLFPP